MKKYLVDDAEYSVWGRGVGPILLFAHGFPFDGAIFEPVISRLCTEFLCVVPDLRGFGDSSLGANGRNPNGAPRVKMGRFADDLAILESEIVCERGDSPETTKIFLCGLSMGGYVSLSFARRRPERLAGLIFCDSNASADSPEKAAERNRLAETIDRDGIPALADGMIPNLLSPKTLAEKPNVVATLREIIERQSPEAIAAGARGMAVRSDSTPFLPEISVPTLVLGGADDKLSPPESLDKIADALPNASRATIPDAGHLPPLENPDAFADAILNWRETTFWSR